MAGKVIKITPEVEEKIIDTFYDTKYSLAQIAIMYNLSHTSIGNILKRNGISIHDRGHVGRKYNFSPEETADMVQMYKDGYSMTAIQKKYDIVGHRTLRSVLERGISGYKVKEYKTPKPKQEFVRGEQYDQLCWHCKNATGGCSWSKSFTPVPGWDAKKVTKSYVDTYDIRDCPLLEKG